MAETQSRQANEPMQHKTELMHMSPTNEQSGLCVMDGIAPSVQSIHFGDNARSRNEVLQLPGVKRGMVFVTQTNMDAGFDSSSEDDQEEYDEPEGVLYCICRKPYEDGVFMIACDTCDEWYHGSCVNIREAGSKHIEKYHCYQCKGNVHPHQGFCEMKKRRKRRRLTESDVDSIAGVGYFPYSNSDASSSRTSVLEALTGRAVTSGHIPAVHSLDLDEPPKKTKNVNTDKCLLNGCSNSPQRGSFFCSKFCNDKYITPQDITVVKADRKLIEAHNLQGVAQSVVTTSSSIGCVPNVTVRMVSPAENEIRPQLHGQHLRQQRAAAPQQSVAPQQSAAPQQQSTAPQQQSAVPRQQSAAPQQRSAASQQQSAAPQQQYVAPQRQSVAPQKEPASPQQPAAHQQRTVTPTALQQHVVLQQQATTPQQATIPPQQAAARQQPAVTLQQQAAAKPQSILPQAQQQISQQQTVQQQMKMQGAPCTLTHLQRKIQQLHQQFNTVHQLMQHQDQQQQQLQQQKQKFQQQQQRLQQQEQKRLQEQEQRRLQEQQRLQEKKRQQLLEEKLKKHQHEMEQRRQKQLQEQREQRVNIVRKQSLGAICGVLPIPLAQQVELNIFNMTGLSCTYWNTEVKFHLTKKEQNSDAGTPAKKEEASKLSESEENEEDKFRVQKFGNTYTGQMDKAIRRLDRYPNMKYAIVSGELTSQKFAKLEFEELKEIETIGEKRRAVRVPFQEILGEDLGTKLEKTLHLKYGGTGKEYVGKVRSLKFNLRNNRVIVEKVQDGGITLEKLLVMTDQELAPDDLAKVREQSEREHMKDIVMSSAPENPLMKLAEDETDKELKRKADQLDIGFGSAISYQTPEVSTESSSHSSPSSTTSTASHSPTSLSLTAPSSSSSVSFQKPLEKCGGSQKPVSVKMEAGNEDMAMDVSDLVIDGEAQGEQMNESQNQYETADVRSRSSSPELPPIGYGDSTNGSGSADGSTTEEKHQLNYDGENWPSLTGVPLWEGTVGLYVPKNRIHASLKQFDVSIVQVGGYPVCSLPIRGEKLSCSGRIEIQSIKKYVPQLKSSSRKRGILLEVRPRDEAVIDDYTAFCQHWADTNRCAVFEWKVENFCLYMIPPDCEQIDNEHLVNMFRAKQPEGCLWAIGIFQRQSAFKRALKPQKSRSGYSHPSQNITVANSMSLLPNVSSHERPPPDDSTARKITDTQSNPSEPSDPRRQTTEALSPTATLPGDAIDDRITHISFHQQIQNLSQQHQQHHESQHQPHYQPQHRQQHQPQHQQQQHPQHKSKDQQQRQQQQPYRYSQAIAHQQEQNGRYQNQQQSHHQQNQAQSQQAHTHPQQQQRNQYQRNRLHEQHRLHTRQNYQPYPGGAVATATTAHRPSSEQYPAYQKHQQLQVQQHQHYQQQQQLQYRYGQQAATTEYNYQGGRAYSDPSHPRAEHS